MMMRTIHKRGMRAAADHDCLACYSSSVSQVILVTGRAIHSCALLVSKRFYFLPAGKDIEPLIHGEATELQRCQRELHSVTMRWSDKCASLKRRATPDRD